MADQNDAPIEVTKQGRTKQHRGNAAKMIDFISRNAELFDDVLARGTLTINFNGKEKQVSINPSLELSA